MKWILLMLLANLEKKLVEKNLMNIYLNRAINNNAIRILIQ